MKAIVVLSGGMDSTVTLALAQACHPGPGEVGALHFQYGQRHSCETECARRIAEIRGVELMVLDAGVLQDIGDSALLSRDDPIRDSHSMDEDLPASWVPGRNLIFLTLAAMVAFREGAREIWTGVGQVDFSGYPDCRKTTISALEVAINLGLGLGTTDGHRPVEIGAPLMNSSKADIWAIASDLGILDLVRLESHSCYEGDRTMLHPWGYGCGICPACVLRAEGWERAEKRRSGR